jgi:hypothetical protein
VRAQALPIDLGPYLGVGGKDVVELNLAHLFHFLITDCITIDNTRFEDWFTRLVGRGRRTLVLLFVEEVSELPEERLVVEEGGRQHGRVEPRGLRVPRLYPVEEYELELVLAVVLHKLLQLEVGLFRIGTLTHPLVRAQTASSSRQGGQRT